MKLSYKLFAIYFLVSLVLLFAVFTTIRIYTTKHFRELDAIMEKEMVTALTYELAIEYQREGSWNKFNVNPGAFQRFVQRVLHKRNEFHRPPDRFQAPGKDFPPPPPSPEGGDMPYRHRISLWSPDKIRIAGPPSETSPSVFEPVTVDGRTVGLVGIENSPPPRHMQTAFLKTRLKVFYTVGIILFLIAAAVSYFLSRFILSPVDQLTKGTKALTQFKFSTRIKVSTRDELGRLAEDFNQMAETLERYENVKKQWIVDISHELRTPLTILKGEIEAMLDGVRDMTENELNSIYSEVLNLETLVNNLHLLSAADAKELKLKKREINPVSILRSVLDTFESTLKQNRLAVKVITGNRDVSIEGDESSIRRLFSNIFENNLKYTGKPGLITVRSEIKDHKVEISIEDTGPGVPASSLKKIFDRLYRIDVSRSRHSGGSGLGLSICRAIVLNHGGSINAALAESGGLKIRILLPVKGEKS